MYVVDVKLFKTTTLHLTMERDNQIDTMKAWLIFFVVLGHMIELTPSWFSSMLHNFIYSFHMPVFIFIAGMFSKSTDVNKSAVRIVKGVLIPLILFTLIYELVWYYKTLSFPSMFTKSLQPFWVLWFLASLLIWRLTAPLLSVARYPLTTSIFISIVVMIYSGYVSEFSLTRSVYFLPFFMLGYLHGSKVVNKINLLSVNSPIIISILSLLLLAVTSYYAHSGISSGKASFVDMKLDTLSGLTSVFLLYASFIFALVFLLRMSSFTTKLSVIGSRSINIYLWHGVVIYGFSSLINKEYVLSNPKISFSIALISSLLLTYILSARIVDYVTKILQVPFDYLLIKKVKKD
ncbi:acyltransferase family protein [Escherichia coli]